jgi:ADP-ribose pyrophosphatase YjhB (NUDIX family)
MKQIIRHGAYGIVIQGSKILLTQKKSGPYKGLWGLPGGAIEFGETPEETLKRELMEESCIEVSKLEFLTIATSTGNYQDNDISYGFHQVGLLYKILDWKKHAEVLPEEENYWFELANIPQKELTPFALHAISILPQNQVWRPPNRIRGKVIGLAKHDNKLLVFEVLDDQGNLKGWCPIGGGIEFGEKAEEALIREINEELKCNVTITGKPIVCENIFEHHGSTGHEIIFAFSIKLSDQKIYSNTRFQICEERGSTHWVEWVPIERFEKSESILFPSILINKLKELS